MSRFVTTPVPEDHTLELGAWLYQQSLIKKLWSMSNGFNLRVVYCHISEINIHFENKDGQTPRST